MAQGQTEDGTDLLAPSIVAELGHASIAGNQPSPENTNQNLHRLTHQILKDFSDYAQQKRQEKPH